MWNGCSQKGRASAEVLWIGRDAVCNVTNVIRCAHAPKLFFASARAQASTELGGIWGSAWELPDKFKGGRGQPIAHYVSSEGAIYHVLPALRCTLTPPESKHCVETEYFLQSTYYRLLDTAARELDRHCRLWSVMMTAKEEQYFSRLQLAWYDSTILQLPLP